MSPRSYEQSPSDSTAKSPATAQPSARPFVWAVHWVFPQAGFVRLPDGESKLGRGPGCRAVLSDTEVSREHALLSVQGPLCELADLQSRNGVSVDGERVSKAPLSDGSIVRLGGTLGVVVYSPDAETKFSANLEHGASEQLGSGKLHRLIERARELAVLDEPVYIHGESGTGKEAFAQILHESSRRRGDFIALNCSTLRGELSSAALFGHVKGAFSGATNSSLGAARAAQRGTLFLDEIAELPRDTQPLLLRLLQNGQITPLGQSEPAHVDTRVVSASHEDLFALCRTKDFRDDLYFRLTTHELRLPPLRERREDIVGLFQYFSGRSLQALSAGFVEALLLLDFPGNVRELKGLAARLKISARDEQIWHAHLLRSGSSSGAPAAVPDPAALDWKLLNEQHGGVAKRISEATGIPATTVKRHLTKNGLR